MGKTIPVLERFFSKVEKKSFGYSTECWIWIAYRNVFGYGTFRGENSKKEDGYKCRLAHRWSYENFVGKIEPGLELDHICKNKACVNPEHLRQVTHARNMEFNSGLNKDVTCCPEGHSYDGDNLYIRTRKDGRVYKICRTCKKDREIEYKSNNRDILRKKALERYYRIKNKVIV